MFPNLFKYLFRIVKLFSCCSFSREGVPRLSVHSLYTAQETVLQDNRGVRVVFGPVQLVTTPSTPQPSKCAIHAVLPRHAYDVVHHKKIVTKRWFRTTILMRKIKNIVLYYTVFLWAELNYLKCIVYMSYYDMTLTFYWLNFTQKSP